MNGVAKPVGQVVTQVFDIGADIVDGVSQLVPQVAARTGGKTGIAALIGLGVGMFTAAPVFSAVVVATAVGWTAERRDKTPAGRLKEIDRLGRDHTLSPAEAHAARLQALDDLVTAKRPAAATRLEILDDCIQRGWVDATVAREFRSRLLQRL